MAHSSEKHDRHLSQEAPSSHNDIPARSRYRPARRSSIPLQPTLKSHTIRLLVATAIAVGVMLFLLMLAAKFAQRDWSQKNKRAWAVSSKAPFAAGSSENARSPSSPEGWTFGLPPTATQMQLQLMASDRYIPNGWLLLARGLSDSSPSSLLIPSLRMAMAISGENAELKNDLGVAYLQQKRIQNAILEFQAADQIRPGFAPARFNLALCALSDRNPTQAIRLLGQYLGQRPDDVVALRLQSTLLSQIGRPQDALNMLEKFLRDQPPQQPLYLEVAVLAARLGQNGNAIRYLETSLNGNSIQSVIRVYQSPSFRDIRLSGDADSLASRLANRARAAFSAPLSEDQIQPLRATTPEAKIR